MTDLPPLFSISIVFEDGHLAFNPSLEKIEHTILSIVTDMIQQTQVGKTRLPIVAHSLTVLAETASGGCCHS